MREGLTAVISRQAARARSSRGRPRPSSATARCKGIVEALVDDGLRELPRGEPAGGAPDRRARCIEAARAPRGGAQGARPGAPQGRARRRSLPGQARRLPGARPGAVRAVHRRGRLGRRLRQAGPRPRDPGHPAAARQDPQRREGAPRQDARERQEIRALITALGSGHRARRVRRRQAALPQDHHHDRRRRRRRAHPHAAAHLLLPPDAGADRARARLHRPAAALPGQEGQAASSTSRTSRALEDYLLELALASAARRALGGARPGRRALRQLLKRAQRALGRRCSTCLAAQGSTSARRRGAGARSRRSDAAALADEATLARVRIAGAERYLSAGRRS